MGLDTPGVPGHDDGDACAELANRLEGAAGAGTEVDLLAEADRAVRMAGGLREHLVAGDWSSAYGAADWLMDLAEVIKAGVAEAHPDARPQVDPAGWVP